MTLSRRLLAILAQRCPVCLEGAMFSGVFAMRERCAGCGHRFMREAGFFQGAMYVSYVVGVFEFAVLALAASVWLAPRIGLLAALATAFAVHLVLVPVLFRYSRVVWAHVNVGTGARR